MQSYPTGASYVHGTATDQHGNTIVTGYFDGALDLDPGPGTSIVTSNQGVVATFIQIVDSTQQFVWGGTLISSDQCQPTSLALASNGDILVMGVMKGTGDFDPGAGTFSMSSVLPAIYILRLDSSGNFKSAGNFPITGMSDWSMAPDTSGGFYIAFGFDNTVDIDLGAGTTNLTAVSNNDAVIAHYDSFDALLWHHHIQGLNDQQVLDVEAAGGRVYLLGLFMDTIDLDPSPGSALFTAPTLNPEGFLACYDQGGSYHWGRQITAGTINGLGKLAVDNAAVNVAISFMDSLDSDLGPGTNWYTLSSLGSFGTFAQQLDGNGNALWTHFWQGLSFVEPMAATMSANGDSYIGFQFADVVDFDPGPGNLTFSAPNFGNGAAVVKIDASGSFEWAGQLEGTGEAVILALSHGNNRLLLGGAQQGLIDFAPFAADTHYVLTQFETGFVAAWSEDSCSSLLARIDASTDVGCGSVAGTMLGHATGGFPPYTYLWNTTPASTTPSASTMASGNFLLTVTDIVGCTASRGVHVGGPTTQNGFDLQANLISGPFRTGFPNTITIDAFNEGCFPIGGVIKVILDSLASFTSSTPTPDSMVGDTAFYAFASMVYGGPHASISMNLLTSLNANIGDTVHLGVVITPVSNDLNPSNNVRLEYAFPVINSFDPNDIQVYPPGACAEHYTLRTQPLTYTVRFQNTGNAEAIRVMVEDSLPSSLDIATIVIKGSSHNMVTEVLPGNVLNFVFDNIFLQDSATNEPASHGWLVFEVMPVSGLPVGTVVENKVGIFFDFNAPIITNTVRNTLVDVIPACFTGSTNETSSPLSVTAYPNPAKGLLHLRSQKPMQAVEVFDLMGTLVLQWNGNVTTVQLSTTDLPRGAYLIRIKATGLPPTMRKVVLE